MSSPEPHRAEALESEPQTESAPAAPSWGVVLLSRVYVRVLIALVLYVLSIGPMFWMWYGSRFIGGDPFLAKLYYPLERLCFVLPAFGKWIDWYIQLWNF